jgi:hypothetical protein
MFLGRAGAKRAASSGDEAAPAAPSWSSALRDAATSVAVPWLLRVFGEKLGADADAVGAPPSVAERARVAGGVSPHRPV